MNLSRALKILLVDDTELNLLLLGKFISKQGHTAIVARNGIEAVEKFQSESPDLVLMDVMMPVMDGFEATAKIRALGGHWVPILFLTAQTGDEDHLRGIQVGGDDFIAKPINLLLLDARIKAVMRIADMQHQILETSRQLEKYRDTNEREISLARHLIDRLTQTGRLDQQRIHSFNLPAQFFSGDIFISACTPTDEVHVLLADGTGHGLSAALSVMPVVDIFYSMSHKGFSISSIASELNRKIRYLMPTERFVAATLISFNFSDKTLQIWNGGNPAVLFSNQDGQILRRWGSNHPALGIFSEHEFDASTEVFGWQDSGRVFLYSDGLPEARDAQGNEFGIEGSEKMLAAFSRSQVNDCNALVMHELAGYTAHDDITLACIDCTIEARAQAQIQAHAQVQTQPQKMETPACRWKIEVRLSWVELKSIDIIPMLLSWMDQLNLEKTHQGQVFLIFTELFNNAMDHGILGLDSRLKHKQGGFEHYIDERRQRLGNLQQGVIEISIERLRQNEQELICLSLHDSGPGFDYQKQMSGGACSEQQPSGRGIALVSQLSQSITYSSSGSAVTALYALGETRG